MSWSKFIVLLSSLLLVQLPAIACMDYIWVGKANAHYSLLKTERYYTEKVKWDIIADRLTSEKRSQNGYCYWNGQYGGCTDGDVIYDWVVYLHNPKLSIDEVGEVLIDLELRDWQAIDSYVNGEKVVLDSFITKNHFVRHLKNHRRNDITKLIIFLKKIEPLADYGTAIAEEMKREGYYGSRDLYALRRDTLCGLLEEGKRLYQEEKDAFLKLRYAYQLVKLAHYAGDFKEAIALYNQHIKGYPDKYALKQWMHLQYAGALSKVGQQSLANYMYVKVFAHGGERSFFAMKEIVIPNQSVWDSTLAFCKTAEEKSSLSYAFYRNGRFINVKKRFDGLKQLLADAPNSGLARNMTMQLINQLEAEVMPLRRYVMSDNYAYWEDSDETKWKNRFNIDVVFNDLHLVLETAIPQATEANQAFLQMANGYLYFLEKDTAQALNWLTQAQNHKNIDPTTAEYAKLFTILIQFQQLGAIDAAVEANLLPQLLWIERSFPKQTADYAHEILIRKYDQQHKWDRSLLLYCKDVNDNLLHHRLKHYLPFMDVVALREKANKTDFEIWLLKGKAEPISNDELREYHLMKLLANFDFSEAGAHAKTFKSPHGNKYAFPNPFKLYTDNAVYVMSGWEEYRKENKRYTRHTFALEMSDVMDSIKAYPDSAKYYLKAALGMAHMQYNGGAWLASSYIRSGGYWQYRNPYSSKAYMGSPEVISYFQKALDLTTNPELKAEALFGMIWYIDNTASNDKLAYLAPRRSGLVRQLNIDYINTRYYREIIRECVGVTQFSTRAPIPFNTF